MLFLELRSHVNDPLADMSRPSLVCVGEEMLNPSGILPARPRVTFFSRNVSLTRRTLLSSFAGRGRKSAKHRQGVRHEDPQQVGDAEARRGERRSPAFASFPQGAFLGEKATEAIHAPIGPPLLNARRTCRCTSCRCTRFLIDLFLKG